MLRFLEAVTVEVVADFAVDVDNETEGIDVDGCRDGHQEKLEPRKLGSE